LNGENIAVPRAVHVGMRWGMIMTSMLPWLRLGAPNAGRTWILHIVALSIAAYGVRSWVVVGTGSRLIVEMTMNFGISTKQHCASSSTRAPSRVPHLCGPLHNRLAAETEAAA
jgi:hypothetical protein